MGERGCGGRERSKVKGMSCQEALNDLDPSQGQGWPLYCLSCHWSAGSRMLTRAGEIIDGYDGISGVVRQGQVHVS